MTGWVLKRQGVSRIAAGLALVSLSAFTATGSIAGETAGEERVLYRCENLQEKSPKSTIGVKLYQGYDGWFFRKSDLENLFEISEESLEAFKRVNDALAYHDIHLILMPMIPRGIVGRDKIPNNGLLPDMIYDADFSAGQFSAFVDTLRQSGIDVVDINRILLDNPDFDASSYAFPGDVHWKPAGAQLVAKAVADKIRELAPDTSNPVTFQTRPSGEEVLVRGNLTKALNEVCQDKIPPDVLKTFKTVQELDTLDSLFADENAEPERELLHIVGTSYTDEALYYNFAGYLREYLQQDVSNFAVAGGGLTEAIYGWTQKSSGLARKPKILLWEYSDLREILKELNVVSRAIVPAILGQCSADLEIASGTFDEGSRFSFSFPETGDAPGNYYLRFSFSNAALTGFRISYRYADGDEELVSFANPVRVTGLREFYQTFPEEKDATPAQVSLQVENDLLTSGAVQLCRFPPNVFSEQPVSN
ncbi:alginate O-acetyltransferase AlgX-related protein [Roseibium sp. Sym1]|uniref:alginate O-acetyltransferase AlgX-related protein n=1 Tax=Roseibium sp. Sym1 TaxID=3016006 RepID=UPI0022B4C968|nr:hypothetical protein [Roseibium sp. Sym1]